MNKSDHIQAVVFDADGTLFDTLPSLAAAANDVLIQAGLCEVPMALLRSALSEGLRPMFRQALALQATAPHENLAAQLEEDYLAHYMQRWLATAPLFARAAETLATLKSQGLKLGICTNRDRRSTDALLASAALAGSFDAIVGLGDAPAPKPAADPLLQVLQQLALSPSQVLFVGDSAMDARCAQAAQVRFAAHLAGYAGQPADLLPQVMGFEGYDQLTQWVLERLPAHKEACHA
ncbi:MAG: hypothetical protein A2Z93_07975 [Curvibacter sp. GWA2_64_110]|nr:MAG: hypothetical protein A2Z93_07975 [Curvibacter sp. GWA2_64_110]HCY15183.1 HAD family hydrolase [Curvibacter sp.]